MTGLGDAVAGWSPAPDTVTDRISRWSVSALTALLDQPECAGLPPLWHWLGFLEHPSRSELGPDGHPADGRFLPPIPQRRRMIAGGRLRLHAPLPIGEPVTRTSTLDSVTVKRGRSGEMAFVTVRHEFRVGATVAAVEEQDVVYRSQAPGQTRALRRPTGEPPDGDWRFSVVPDEMTLFRFSALTYNTHRIHYDQAYVTQVEGYPGLVVHGPLLALLLLEIPRRFRPDRAVTSFDYRLLAPTFAGETVEVTGTADGDEVSLTAAVPGLGPSITGTAVLA
ncbi:MAG TPA: MaoC family dehydratase N-terminal domain-containing protein [Pseudonocardiaceae bacterium]|jgi:3-methylfumaryl-CoA hydratase